LGQIHGGTTELASRPFTAIQEASLGAAWLELHRRIWNYGLALLQELDQFSAYDKASKERVPYCPVPWSYHWQKAEEESWQAPNNLIRGGLQALGVAWKEYKSGKKDSMGRTRKPPRFKGQKFPITTLKLLNTSACAEGLTR
jgi:hypothetical protein